MNFILGLWHLIDCKSSFVNVRIVEKWIEIEETGQRWFVPMDGFGEVKQLGARVWMLQNPNGTVINIPAEAISDEQLLALKQWIRCSGSINRLRPDLLHAQVP